jgi:hypothetical protein
MTEVEWLHSEHVRPMLAVVAGRGGGWLWAYLGSRRARRLQRKLRLLLCGCWRASQLSAPGWGGLVEAAEQIADGEGSSRELRQTRRRLACAQDEILPSHLVWLYFSDGYADHLARLAASAWFLSVARVHQALVLPWFWGRSREVRAVEVIREVFGNPFRRPNFGAAKEVREVRSLATMIYRTRAFEEMPILADALEEAGCPDEVVLAHCRQQSGHVRGCWVLDDLLGWS